MDYKKMLNGVKILIGKENVDNLIIAVLLETYLDDKKVTDEEFNSVCGYIKGFVNYNHSVELDLIIFWVCEFLENNTVEDLLDVSYNEFIDEFIADDLDKCYDFI